MKVGVLLYELTQRLLSATPEPDGSDTRIRLKGLDEIATAVRLLARHGSVDSQLLMVKILSRINGKVPVKVKLFAKECETLRKAAGWETKA